MTQNGPYLLGIDSGLTVTKAVVFSTDGQQLSVASSRVNQHTPFPRFVERDMEEVWHATVNAIRGAIRKAAIDANEIQGVGVTGHGDGLYVVDQNLRPLGRGILSLDSRAVNILSRWRDARLFDKAMSIAGQQPLVSSPAPLLAWLKETDPERYSRIGWILSCKDWLRLCLTGQVATDITEGSVSFTNVETQTYDDEILTLYDLLELKRRLPEMFDCTQQAGQVTEEASTATGLPCGLPVVTGLHDVTAAAIGLGTIAPNELAVTAGTYSINETISTKPMRDSRWFCRNSFRRGEWMNMSISPASSGNMEWFVQHLCQKERLEAEKQERNVFDFLQDEIEAAFQDNSHVVFHPFLYGSPLSDHASASFFGVMGWNSRGHLLRAVLEGIAFNHRTHVETLKDNFPLQHARVTGGGAKNPRLLQLFADNFKLPIETTTVEEVSALGAALCAGVGTGIYTSINDAVTQAVRVKERVSPQEASFTNLDHAYQRYLDLADALRPLWGRLESGGSSTT